MRTLIHVVLMSCLAAMAGTARAETLEEVLACHAEAIGGAAALAAVGNLRVELDIREPTFEVRGTYVADRRGWMRIDIFAGEQRVFAEGLNEDGAWQWKPEAGVTASNAAGAAALRNGIESPGRFWTLSQLRERGLRIEFVQNGSQAREGEWHLKLTRADDSQLDYFVNRETCLPTREFSRRAFHPDVNPTEVTVETTFSEPYYVDGVLRLRKSESRNLATGEWLGTTAVLSVEHNASLPEGFFGAH